MSTNRAEITMSADLKSDPINYSSHAEPDESLSASKQAERSKFILDSLLLDITTSSLKIQK